jgi:hypothetical protein
MASQLFAYSGAFEIWMLSRASDDRQKTILLKELVNWGKAVLLERAQEGFSCKVVQMIRIEGCGGNDRNAAYQQSVRTQAPSEPGERAPRLLKVLKGL